MQTFPKLRSMLEAALTQAAKECGMLIGQELAVGETTCRQLTRDAYLDGLENASFVVGVESHEDYPGKFYLVLALRDAIVLSSILLGVPPARISEKKRLAIVEADDVDAFSEIANQVTGSFNAVFKPGFPGKVQLKQLAPRQFIPGKDVVGVEEPFDDGEYYLVQSQLALTGQELERIDLLLPLSLANLFEADNGGETDECADAAAVVADLPAEPAAEAELGSLPETVLILEDNVAERTQFQEILAAAGLRSVAAPFNADLKKVLPPGSVRAVVLGVANGDDRELALCARIAAHFQEMPVPLIVCAREWTRTGVLRALKYGAREILLKPCAADELAAKVKKLVNAT